MCPIWAERYDKLNTEKIRDLDWVVNEGIRSCDECSVGLCNYVCTLGWTLSTGHVLYVSSIDTCKHMHRADINIHTLYPIIHTLDTHDTLNTIHSNMRHTWNTEYPLYTGYTGFTGYDTQ